MIEYKLNSSEAKREAEKIRIGIVSSFTSEYIGTPMYFGKLEDGTDVVLKFSKIPGSATREFNGLSLANVQGVPSPKAIALIQRTEQPSEGLVMQRIEGKPLNEIGDTGHEFQLGQALHRLHEIKLLGYGPITNGYGQHDNSESYLKYWLEKTVPYMGKQGQAMLLMTELFTQGKDHILNEEPRLLHRDVRDENVFVQPDGNISIIDFEWAQGGNRFDDLAVYLYHSIRTDKPQERVQAFFSAYFVERELVDLEKYDLLFHLVLAAGRTVSFCARMNPPKLEEATADMNKIVRYVKGILRNTPGYPNYSVF